VTEHFYLKGNATGLKKVDGVYVGTRPLVNTLVGFGLPYGQKVTQFGYDPKSALLYTGFTASGQPLLLSGVLRKDGTAALKTATKGEKGSEPIECTVLAETLLCGAIINGVNYNKLVLEDFKSDGNYEVALSAVFATAVQLVVSKDDK
jgi:hypothetical protein